MAIPPVTASIAVPCTATAASAGSSEPEAVVICRADASPMQIGISAGISINPAPCAVDIMKDDSASPA